MLKKNAFFFFFTKLLFHILLSVVQCANCNKNKYSEYNHVGYVQLNMEKGIQI